MTNVALITGITGQDGSYLAEMLLEKEYIVYGIVRRASNFNTQRIESIFNHPNLRLRHGDCTDLPCLVHILEEIRRMDDLERLYVYNLAAQSHVKVSFEVPLYTAQVDAIGVLNLLEAIRVVGMSDKTRFYQASTSELYGKVQEPAQSETTPLWPQSPYATAKLYAYWIVRNYREGYGMYACNGILFNHESERRGLTFVTRKITRAVAKIHLGKQDCIYLGNIDSLRDWGYAPDYCRGMMKIMEQETPDDFVLGTGENHSVREFVELAFKEIGIEIEWQGEGVDEIGVEAGTDRVLVKIDEKYFRPLEVETLLANPAKANNVLGWKPETSFPELVQKMVRNDIKEVGGNQE
eukprot:TRINITY_DN597_c1_g1_i1.p1 TRINITY_DN597_c1_g1~~TRINITY_DN597_c1_g1_i1.p1  ORF type:complete len:351 (-),score=78.58 TRINITY_DN597_c1_g1_i1:34-1086(-)